MNRLTPLASVALSLGFLASATLAKANENNAFLVNPVMSAAERASVRAQLDTALALEISGLQDQPANVRDWALEPFNAARQAAATGPRWDLQDKAGDMAIRAHVVAMMLPNDALRRADVLAQHITDNL